MCVRHASKKTIGTIHNAGNAKPKRRGWKFTDGDSVHAGNILVTQTKTRFHPGLNVIIYDKTFLCIHVGINLTINKYDFCLGWVWQ